MLLVINKPVFPAKISSFSDFSTLRDIRRDIIFNRAAMLAPQFKILCQGMVLRVHSTESQHFLGRFKLILNKKK